MSKRPITATVLGSLIAIAAGIAQSEPASDPSRGELLYSTHCIACHTTNIHWRDNSKAKDWDSLNAQVRLWQQNTGLGWSEDDVLTVAAYLNTLFYHYPPPKGKEIALTKSPG